MQRTQDVVKWLSFLSLVILTGCHELDKIVVPLNNATLDLNRTKETLSLPTEIFPGANIRLKGSKLAVEKKF